MAYPTLVPSSRSYNSGDYPVKTFRSQSGSESRILYGNRRTGMTLELQYDNITDANAQLFIVDYENKKGSFESFILPEELLIGWGGNAEVFAGSLGNTRSTIATYIDGQGVLQTAQPYETRSLFNTETGLYSGLLVERSATNLMSNSLLSSGWFVGATLVAADISNPSKNIGGVYYGLPSGIGPLEINKEFTATGYSTVTVSYFAKRRLESATNNVTVNMYRDTTLGEGGTLGLLTLPLDGTLPSLSSTSAFSNPRRETLANGWRRLGFTVTAAFTANSRLDFEPTADTNYIWGVQIEPGPEMTSYIATNGTTVTRAADTFADVIKWRYDQPPQVSNIRPGISSVQIKLIGVL